MAIVSLPLGVLAAFLVMRYQGVNANIMSLGGIAIAIGAMVDAAVVMIENAPSCIASSNVIFRQITSSTSRPKVS